MQPLSLFALADRCYLANRIKPPSTIDKLFQTEIKRSFSYTSNIFHVIQMKWAEIELLFSKTFVNPSLINIEFPKFAFLKLLAVDLQLCRK